MKRKLLTIACAVMLLLSSAGSTIYAEDESQEEEQTQDVETTTNEDEEEDRQTADDTKQKLEEISTKVDKVDNQIAQQMVDAETLKEQGKEIKDIKEQVNELKSAINDLDPIPSYGNQYVNIPYDVDKLIPLQKNKPYYIYRLTVGPQLDSMIGNRVYIFASNSDDLSIGWYYGNPGQSQIALAIKGIYAENDRKQPICGCKVSYSFTEEDAINFVKNRDNWGWTTLTENPIAGANQTIIWGNEICEQRNTGDYAAPTNVELLTPYGEQYVSEEQTGPEYWTGIGTYIRSTSTPLFARLYQPSNISFTPTLEIIETVEPSIQEWTTEQLYMPVLLIMSILVIILFKKH